jgi:hypothetical protein
MASTSSDVGASSGDNLRRAHRLNALPENDDEELIVVDDDDGDTRWVVWTVFTSPTPYAVHNLRPVARCRHRNVVTFVRVNRRVYIARRQQQVKCSDVDDTRTMNNWRVNIVFITPYRILYTPMHRDCVRYSTMHATRQRRWTSFGEYVDEVCVTCELYEYLCSMTGKNKIAARNCRDRVTSTLTQLETEALVLEHELQAQLRRQDQLRAAVRAETEAIDRLTKEKRERR